MTHEELAAERAIKAQQRAAKRREKEHKLAAARELLETQCRVQFDNLNL